MSLYARHLDGYENLKLIFPNMKRVIQDQTNVNLNGLTITYRHILVTTIDGFEKVLTNPELFAFLRSIGVFFEMRVNNNREENIQATLEKLYQNEGNLLKETLEFTGLIP
jgi:hypothetical protein